MVYKNSSKIKFRWWININILIMQSHSYINNKNKFLLLSINPYTNILFKNINSSINQLQMFILNFNSNCSFSNINKTHNKIININNKCFNNNSNNNKSYNNRNLNYWMKIWLIKKEKNYQDTFAIIAFSCNKFQKEQKSLFVIIAEKL